MSTNEETPFTIPREALAASVFASKDITRAHLTHVHVEADGEGKHTLVATDGHRLICCHWYDPSNVPVTAMHMVATEVLEFLKYCKKDMTFNAHTADGVVKLSTKKRSTDVSPEGPVAFPPWRQVVPTLDAKGTPGGIIRLGFNVGYLVDFAKYLTSVKAAVGCRMEATHEEGAPLLFTPQPVDTSCGAMDVQYVLMPHRL